MKKILAILLLATLAISICACGSNGIKLNEDGYPDAIIIENNNSYEESDNNIELTTSNISDFLQIEMSDGNLDSRYHSDGMGSLGNSYSYMVSDLYIDIYPISTGSFENVIITLELTAPNKWIFLDDDEYDNNKEYSSTREVDIILRVNGESTNSYQIASDEFDSRTQYISSDYSYQIISVSGTLVKD